MKKGLSIIIVIILGLGLAHFFVIPFVDAISFPDEIRLTSHEFSNKTPLQTNSLISQRTNLDSLCTDTPERHIDLKLFGLIPIKRIKVDVFPFETVAVGGLPIGFIAKSDGAIVLEDVSNFNLKKGDVIKSVNNTPITSAEDFNSLLEAKSGKTTLKLEVDRNGRHHTTEFETVVGKNRLGLWLKDEIGGVGVLTYVNPENNNFAALGHKVTDYETGSHVDIRGGDVWTTNIVGIEKSDRTRVGEFKSALRSSSGKQGVVHTSSEGGVFGCFFADSQLLKATNKTLPITSRYGVRPGAAKLRTSLDGEKIEEFDIEIIKTSFQKNRGVKSMVIRVTDKSLLERTGGIIHGMSGSPIIQDGHLVGALTHVILGDTTKGYGIYIDFVLP